MIYCEFVVPFGFPCDLSHEANVPMFHVRSHNSSFSLNLRDCKEPILKWLGEMNYSFIHKSRYNWAHLLTACGVWHVFIYLIFKPAGNIKSRLHWTLKLFFGGGFSKGKKLLSFKSWVLIQLPHTPQCLTVSGSVKAVAVMSDWTHCFSLSLITVVCACACVCHNSKGLPTGRWWSLCPIAEMFNVSWRRCLLVWF